MATPHAPTSTSTAAPTSSAEPAQTTSTVRRFTEFLHAQGERWEVSEARPLGGGRSAQMLALRLTDVAGDERDVVLAREAADGPVSGMASVRRQFDVLKALETTAVKAPRALWVCEDVDTLGAPFLVTEMMPGRVADPWRPDGRAFLRTHRDDGQFRDSIVRALVDIHAVAGEALPQSARRDRSVSAARREVGRWLARIERSPRFRDDPVLAYAAAWLERHEPDQADWTLFHGDFRVGNLLVDGPSVTAVLDWEFAEEGNPVFDVALLCSLPMMVDGRLDGIWDADDLLARYEAMSGRHISEEEMRYYLVLSAFKIASVWVNGSVRFSDGVDDLHSLRAGFSAIDLLLMVATALDLPVPPGEEQPEADPMRRALALLRRSLLDDVMPSLDDGVARERAAVILAALRSLTRRPDRTPAHEGWEQAVLAFLTDLGAQSADFHDDLDASARVRLTRAIRWGFGPSGPDLESGAVAARLRELGRRRGPLHVGGVAVSPATPLSAADETLLHQLAKPFAAVEDAAPTWFDRFYFNLHPQGPGPLLVIGGGVYPNVEVIDGYACVAAGERQHNIRFSAPLGAEGRARTEMGPLRWEVEEPLRRWRLRLDAAERGLTADVTFTARTEPYAVEPIAVAHDDGPRTEFWHYFQAGEYEGVLQINGERCSVDGWRGLRDRSWGVRRTRERLGIHMWGGVQFDDWCLAVNYNEDREGRPTHLDGAWMPVGGAPSVPVTGFRHDLRFDAAGELQGGTVQAQLTDGRQIELSVRSLGRGVYMAGAGYGGWHGQPRGVHEEYDSLALDGSVSPRSLPLGLVDKLCAYSDGDREGFGVFELAASRSSSYVYRPTILPSN